MSKLKGIILLLSFAVVFPAFADMETVQDEESNPLHVAIMILSVFVVLILMVLCWKCGKLYGGTMGNGFKMIGTGIGVLGLREIFIILDHFKLMVWGSTADHFIGLIAFVIVGIGLWTIFKYIISPEGKLGRN